MYLKTIEKWRRDHRVVVAEEYGGGDVQVKSTEEENVFEVFSMII